MTRLFDPSVDDGDPSVPGAERSMHAAEPAGPAGEAASEASREDAPSAIEALTRERDEYKDRLLRATADFDNYRKRVERERRELVEHATADLLQEILPTLDDLERALSAADETESVARYREGVEIIYRHLVDVLKKRGVTPIDAVGTPFDPHLHHAVAREPSDAHQDGEVIAELRKGYTLAARLLRASLVKVAARE